MEEKKKSEIKPFEYEDTPLSFRFNLLAKKYYGAASSKLEGFDLERYFFILTIIHDHIHISQQCLAKCMDIDKATVVRVIDYLSEKGLVKRERNDADRREHIISTTAKGKKLVPKIHEVFEQLNKTAFKGFTKDERMLFNQMTSKMMLNLSGLPISEFGIKYVKKK